MEHMISLDDVPEGFWRAHLSRRDYLSLRYGPIGGRLAQGGRNLLPIHELMKAVLEDALHCLSSKKTHSARQRDLDILWLMAKTNNLFSFENICLELGLNASYVRSNILKHIKTDKGNRRRVRVRTNVYTYMGIAVNRFRSRQTSPWASTTSAKLSIAKND